MLNTRSPKITIVFHIKVIVRPWSTLFDILVQPCSTPGSAIACSTPCLTPCLTRWLEPCSTTLFVIDFPSTSTLFFTLVRSLLDVLVRPCSLFVRRPCSKFARGLPKVRIPLWSYLVRALCLSLVRNSFRSTCCPMKYSNCHTPYIYIYILYIYGWWNIWRYLKALHN